MTRAIDKSTAPSPRNEDDEPYRRIWASVLYLAIRDCNRGGYQRVAMNWIYSSNTHVGSLRWICDMLDLDFNAVQQMCMTREGRSKILESNARMNRDPYRTALASID